MITIGGEDPNNMRDQVEDIAAKHERIGRRVNQALSPFGLMITVDRTARVTETTGISSELPASKSMQSQAAEVPSVGSLLRGTRRRRVRLAEIRKVCAHQPHIGRHPIAEGRVRPQRENHVHHVIAAGRGRRNGKAQRGGRVQFIRQDSWAEAREKLRSVGGRVGRSAGRAR